MPHLNAHLTDSEFSMRSPVLEPPRLGAPRIPLWDGGTPPDPGEETLTRKQWIAQESANQATKTVAELADKNATLLWEARQHREVKDKLAAGGVVVSKEDAAALTTYREFGTPDELRSLGEKNAKLEGEQKRLAWNTRRAEQLSKYDSDKVAPLIPTAEELEADGDLAKLDKLEALDAQVAKVAGAFDAVRKAERKDADVGAAPAEKTGHEQPPKTAGTGADAVSAYRNRHKSKTT